VKQLLCLGAPEFVVKPLFTGCPLNFELNFRRINYQLGHVGLLGTGVRLRRSSTPSERVWDISQVHSYYSPALARLHIV